MNDTLALLKEHRLQEVLDNLQPAFSDGSRWELNKEYTDICNTYRYLLDYFRQGTTDTERERVFTRLAGRVLLLSERLELEKRQGALSGFGIPSLWTVGDAAYTTQRLRSDAPITEKCLLLSDMTLSLLVVFDPLKIPVLCEAATSSIDEVAVRAVTAIDLMLRCGADRLPFYPDAATRLQLLFADSLFIDMLTDVELQLSHSLDTERIERQMRDEIIPAMLRSPMSPFNPPKHNQDKDADDASQQKKPTSPFSDDISMNPDWEDWLEKSGIEESLRELTELQMSGADVYMATFSQMKSYPFFNCVENWFRPFDPTNPAVSELFPADKEQEPTLQRFIMQSDTFCNSDKYSFCLAMNQFPSYQRDLLRDQISQQDEAMKEDLSETLRSAMALRKGKPTTRTLTRQYMQDLYRFFHLCPRRQNYINPFDSTFVHSTLQKLTDAVSLPAKSFFALAELDIQRKDYEGAGALFSHIIHYYPDQMDATLWQKAGYCHQMAGQYSEAIEALTMADVLRPSHAWTMLHLAQCHRSLGNHAQALEYYADVAKLKPDDLRILWQQARLLMKLNREEEALPMLQQLAYQEPESQKVLCTIIEAYLILRHNEQAAKYTDRMMMLTGIDFSFGELFTAACAYWQCGRRDEALTLFQHAVTQGAFDEQKAAKYGIPQSDIPFLRDLVLSLT